MLQTVDTPANAEILNRLHRATTDYAQVAQRVAQMATRIPDDLAKGIRPEGTHRQYMTDLIDAEAKWQVMVEMAMLTRIDRALVTLAVSPDADVYFISPDED